MSRTLYTALFWAAVTFVGGMLLLLAMPKLVGGQSMPVLSDSMAPSIRTGDEVVVMPVDARSLEPGEVAVFNDPEQPSKLLNHRVQSVTERDGMVRVVTLGDSNTRPERWAVPSGAEVGHVVAKVPKVGFLLRHLGSRDVLVWGLVVPALGLCLWLLLTIWRLPEDHSRPEPER